MSDLEAIKELLSNPEPNTTYFTNVEIIARKIISVEKKCFYGDKSNRPLGEIRELISKGVKNAD